MGNKPKTLYGNSRELLEAAERKNELLAQIAGETYTNEGNPSTLYNTDKALLAAANKENEFLEAIADGAGTISGANKLAIDYGTDVLTLKKNDTAIADSGVTLPAYGVSFDPTTGGLTLTKNGTAISGQTVTIPNYGSPVAVEDSTDMTDHDTIYLYEGTTGETYTNGHFYYWDGAAWADGGEYAAATVQTDKTLSVEDRAADAKAVGGAVADLKTQITPLGVFPIVLDNLNHGYNTGNETIDPANPTSTNQFDCTAIDCSEGDVFTIHGGGATGNSLPWAFLDSSNNVVKKAQTLIVDEIITAPANAVKLVLNNHHNYSSYVSYYGANIEKVISDTRDDIDKLDDAVDVSKRMPDLTFGYYINASGGKSSGNYSYSAPVAVRKGEKVILYAAGYSTTVAMISLCDSTGSNIVPKVMSIDSDVHTYSYDVTENGYIMICFYSAKGYTLYLYGTKSPSVLYDDITTLQSSVGELENTVKTEAVTLSLTAGKYINSNGGLSNGSAFSYSAPVAVQAGQRLIFITTGYSTTVAMISMCDSNGDNIVPKVMSMDSKQHVYSYDVTENGYAIFCFHTSDGYSLYIGDKKSAFAFADLENLRYQYETGIIPLNHGVQAKILQGRMKKRDVSLSSSSPSAYVNLPNVLTLLHFSDIHSSKRELQRIVEFQNRYADLIDDAICSGDMVLQKYADGMDFWDAVDGAENIMMCIGNHDVAVGTSYSSYGVTVEEAYDQYFDPYIENWGVTHEGTATYYYKDYTTSKIRLIVLDYLLTGADATAQAVWLSGALAGAKTAGYAVVCVNHVLPADPVYLDCTFTSSINQQAGTCPEAFMDAVDEFISDGGVFVCWLCGHAHNDYIAYSASHPHQVFLCVTCGKCNTGWENAARQVNDKSQDAFNVVCLDGGSQLVKVIRVGQDRDSMMRKLDTLTLDVSVTESHEHATIIHDEYTELIKALSDEVDNLNTQLTTYTGNDEIKFTSGYINTSGTTADVTDIHADSHYRCAVVECSRGDEFVVNVKGATLGRAFAFVAENGTVLFNAGNNTTTEDRLLVAPANTKWLVLNDNNTGKKSYINNLLVNVVENTKKGLDDIATKQQFTLVSETVSGTGYVTVPIAFLSGTYHIHCDSVDSSDTSALTYSRIIFNDGTTNGKAINVTRTGYDADITFANDVRQFTCYAKDNAVGSSGLTFSYNNLTITKNTTLNERIKALENAVVTIDATLTEDGQAADAQATGTAIDAIDEKVENISNNFVKKYIDDTIFGTRSKTVSVDIPSGNYNFHVDDVDSTDTVYTASKVIFWNGTDQVLARNISRTDGIDEDITFANAITSVSFYGASNYNDSDGVEFSFNNVVLVGNIYKFIDCKINPYQDVIFASDDTVKTTTHNHCTNQTGLDHLMAQNLDALAISNYYPSDPTYPLDEVTRYTFTDIPDVIEIPNAEQHGITNNNWHVSSFGSMFAAGKPSGQTPVGTQDTIEHVITKIKRDLLYPDGGGMIINHPTGYTLTAMNNALDYDDSVLGIEIFNDTNAHWHADGHDYETTGDNPLGWTITQWDNILKSGRRCWGFAVPDHYCEGHDDWRGSITVFVPEATQENVLKAVRKGAYYIQMNHTTLALTDFVYTGNTVSIAVSETATIKAVVNGEEYATKSGTSMSVNLPYDSVYVRFEISTENDTIYTNPLMLKKMTKILPV